MKQRHWGVLISFVLSVVLPILVVGYYLWAVADGRYGSTTGFTVRQEEGHSSSELLSGLAQFTGSSNAPDADVLYEFIRSQKMVRRVDERLDLRGHYSAHWRSDPVFALWPDATIEDLLWYWGRMVRVSYDAGTGLTQLEVTAYSPEMAQRIGQEIVAESQRLVNALNEAARRDAIRYAELDLHQAQKQLREAREALIRFRTRTQIVDLEADIQARMAVVNRLQQQLAEELLAFDELKKVIGDNDPRLTQALRRIEVIRERITEERRALATTEVLSTGEDYPTLIAEFEGLTVDREYAEEAYRTALSARNAARDSADRQTRYLATYIAPTLAEKAEYPERGVLFGLSVLFLVLAWGIAVLVYYSIRDRN
jgi:capsular polysaccharide transport system permease protein